MVGSVKGRAKRRLKMPISTTHDVLTNYASARTRPHVGKLRVMRVRSAIGRVLAVLAVAGLVLVPITRPAMAMSVAGDIHANMGDAVAVGSVIADAADEMPCCPSKPALPDCSKDCPLMALCGTAPLYFLPQTGLIVPVTFVSIVFPRDHSALVSIAQAPPRRPPKI
jgi:hypothetical protein